MHSNALAQRNVSNEVLVCCSFMTQAEVEMLFCVTTIKAGQWDARVLTPPRYPP